MAHLLRSTATIVIFLAFAQFGQTWLISRSSCRAPTSNSERYREDVAHYLLRYSFAAYEESGSIDDWTCTHCRHLKFRPIDTGRIEGNHGTRALVGYDTRLKSIVVAFRGSSNWKNWVANSMFWHSTFSYGSGKVHTGMLRLYKALRNSVMKKVRELLKIHSRVGIYVTGHSLGGALATLGAVDLKRHYSHNQLTMYNFGSPRVGDACFVQDYARRVTRSIRFVNKYDWAPHIPAANQFGFTYKHVPKQVTVSRSIHHVHNTYLGIRNER